MHDVVYSAVVEKTETGVSVWFPDLPGCTAATDRNDWPSIHSAAAEALALHLEGMLEDGEPLPEADPLEHSMRPEDMQSPVIAAIWVRASVPETPRAEPVRVNVSFGKALLARIDLAARRQHMTRSGWLAAAAQERMRAAKREPMA